MVFVHLEEIPLSRSRRKSDPFDTDIVDSPFNRRHNFYIASWFTLNPQDRLALVAGYTCGHGYSN